jgi:hypothetical protein
MTRAVEALHRHDPGEQQAEVGEELHTCTRDLLLAAVVVTVAVYVPRAEQSSSSRKALLQLNYTDVCPHLSVQDRVRSRPPSARSKNN